MNFIESGAALKHDFWMKAKIRLRVRNPSMDGFNPRMDSIHKWMRFLTLLRPLNLNLSELANVKASISQLNQD